MIFYTGLGWVVCFGLLFVMLTEAGLRAITDNPAIIRPHSWWVMSGYSVAALYCLGLYWLLAWRERSRGSAMPTQVHTFLSLPIWCCSIGYLALGFLRFMSPK